MDDDAALLHAYAEEGSESAFTALVRRHVDLVYAAALRRLDGDSHLAADVAQQVFATLARQLRRSWRPRVLSAWLHTATRNAAANAMTSEKRRRIREQVALDPAFAAAEATPEWTQLRPVLDAAIDELPETDREAVVLRFLERKAFGEIGEALSVSADAARMRTERALDKLRAALAKRGITSTAAAVGAIISSQPLISAPTGLVGSIAASSFAATGAGTGALAVGVAAIFMNFKTLVVGVAVLSAFLGGTYIGLMQQLDAPPLPTLETPRHSQTIADLRKENLALRNEVDQLKAANTRPATPAASAQRAATPDLVSNRQRATLENLKQLAAARDQFLLEYGRMPSFDELVGPDNYVKRLVTVNGEDYSTVKLTSGTMTVMTNDGPVSFDKPPVQPPTLSRHAELQRRISQPLQAALQAYHTANPGEIITNSEAGMKALIPFFATPEAGADFVEYVEVMRQAGRLQP